MPTAPMLMSMPTAMLFSMPAAILFSMLFYHVAMLVVACQYRVVGCPTVPAAMLMSMPAAILFSMLVWWWRQARCA